MAGRGGIDPAVGQSGGAGGESFEGRAPKPKSISIAGNGFDAGMMVKEYRPDLIILDVMLPDINGKEVCHRVRADTAMEDVRIICISGMIEDDKIQELKLAGADDFLPKPFAEDARRQTRLTKGFQLLESRRQTSPLLVVLRSCGD